MKYAYPKVETPLSRDRLCELLDHVTKAAENPRNIWADMSRDYMEALKELILLRDVCGTVYDAAVSTK